MLPYSFTSIYSTLLPFLFHKMLHSPLLHSQFSCSYLLSSVSFFTLFLFVTPSFSSTPFFLCEAHRVQRYMRFSSPCPPSYSSLLTAVKIVARLVQAPMSRGRCIALVPWTALYVSAVYAYLPRLIRAPFIYGNTVSV